MVQIHRCPATVSGTKSAKTTEAHRLGKVQRVDSCREPGDLPYRALRRPFEGKGRQLVWADPDRSWLGFFMRAAFPGRVGLHSFPRVGREGRGKASRGSSRSIASLFPAALADPACSALLCAACMSTQCLSSRPRHPSRRVCTVRCWGTSSHSAWSTTITWKVKKTSSCPSSVSGSARPSNACWSGTCYAIVGARRQGQYAPGL